MRRYLVLLSLLLVLFPQSSFAQTFSRTLFLGVSGEDVRTLQIILNKDERTMIAVSGPGSSGNETIYFGLKTKDAVMRFQNLYKNEVLIPAGIISPTGIVGLKTQAKLLALNNATDIKQVMPPNVPVEMPIESRPETLTEFLASFFKLPPKLFSVLPLTVKTGGEIVIRGQGFTNTGNTVHFGSGFSVENVSSPDGITINVGLPANVIEGSYNVWVSNKGGSTYNASYGDFFTVSKNPIAIPEIVSLSEDFLIQYGASSSAVSLATRGMSAGNTKILTSLGEIQGTIDQNGIVKFTLMDAPGWKDLTVPLAQETNRRLPVYVYLRNSAGFSAPVIVWVYFPKP